MFESLRQENPGNVTQYFVSVSVSLVAHAAAVAVLVVLPLILFNGLRTEELLAFLIEPPYRIPVVEGLPIPPGHATFRGANIARHHFSPVPERLPKGIAAPDEPVALPDLGEVAGSIGIPIQQGFAGTNLATLLEKITVLRPPLPEPPVPRAPVFVSSGVQESRLVFGPAPVYPPLAIQTRTSGVVEILAWIDEEGNVTEVRAVSGHPLLVPSALEAVKQWKYSPTILNGEPQRVQAVVRVVFRLR